MSLKLSDSMHSPTPEKGRQKAQKPVVKFKPYSSAPEPVVLKPKTAPLETGKPRVEQPKPAAESRVSAKQAEGNASAAGHKWLAAALWGVSGAMLLALVGVVLSFAGVFGKSDETPAAGSEPDGLDNAAVLPEFNPSFTSLLRRNAKVGTTIPERSNVEVIAYPVEALDSVFGVAAKFDLSPYSIIWSNKFLEDNPQMLSVGMILNIPPEDGAYYEWQANDTLAGVAGYYQVDPDAIVEWPGNHLDLADPQIEVGQYVFIPGGTGKFESFDSPDPYTPNSAVAKSLMNACQINPGYSWGTGTFIWPTDVRSISGFNYDPYTHKGIDIGALLGDTVYAADSGVVIWAASMSGGYGQVIFIQHDTSYNVYHTVYAHLSAIYVTCGQSVYQGQAIGAVGNSGNSYGAHLHFELRQDGGFLNPLWYLN